MHKGKLVGLVTKEHKGRFAIVGSLIDLKITCDVNEKEDDVDSTDDDDDDDE